MRRPGICGRCQVVVSEGEFAKHGIRSGAAHLTPFSVPEQTYRDRSGLAPERRLGCHACVVGDLVVDVPPESQLHRQVVRKEADAHAIEVDPIVRLHYVEVREPDMADPSGDLERLFEALERDWSLTDLDCDDHVLAALQRDAPDGGLDSDRRRARRRDDRRASGRGSVTARWGWRSTSDRRRWRASCATWRAGTCSRSPAR